jgi:multidrug resistance efflux pump
MEQSIPGTDLRDRVRSLRLDGRNAGGKPAPRTRWLPWIFCIVLLFTSATFAYRAYRVGTLPGQSAAGPRDEPAVTPGTTPAAPAVSASAGEVVLQAKGYIIPISLVQVSPKVGGQLVKIAEGFEEGAVFTRDQVLAWIEDKDYRAEFDQANFAYDAARKRWEELKKTMPEEIKQAEAELEETRQNATQLRLDVDRNRRLVMGAALPQREQELTQYAYEATRARIKRLESGLRMLREGRAQFRIDTAEAEMNQARAMKEKAALRLEWTRIKAPITGTILTKKAEEGNIVNPSAFSSGISASLCEMADLTKLEVDLSIQERDVAAVKTGQRCAVMPEAYQNDKEFLAKHPQGYEGVVSRIMPTADRAKGAVPVRVRILGITPDEAGKYLRPEMSALVSFKKK